MILEISHIIVPSKVVIVHYEQYMSCKFQACRTHNISVTEEKKINIQEGGLLFYFPTPPPPL